MFVHLFSEGNKKESRWNKHWWSRYCWKSSRTRNSHSICVRNTRTKIGRWRYSTSILFVERCVPECELHSRRNVQTQGRNSQSLRRRVLGVRWRWWTRIALDGKSKFDFCSPAFANFSCNLDNQVFKTSLEWLNRLKGILIWPRIGHGGYRHQQQLENFYKI